MADVFKEKIKMIRGDLTYEQFAKELSKSGLPFGKAIVWRYENEKDLYPGFAFFYASAKVFRINLNWLIADDGPMIINYSNDLKIGKSRVPKGTSKSSKTPDRRQVETSKASQKRNTEK